jgi:hypothetical protein
MDALQSVKDAKRRPTLNQSSEIQPPFSARAGNESKKISFRLADPSGSSDASIMRSKQLPLLALCLVFLLCGIRAQAAAVNVILWFDTEDYLLPADDDAAKRLAEMLSARGIRATFKVVGEKARVLERRGRRDVIDALRKHEIGYHANLHSVHPTPSEYLADCGWLDGIAEFVRREGAGAADVRRIFDKPTLVCYGQPGASWAPQAIAALKQIGVAPHGVPCYVDEGTHVGLDEQPFWFDGAINVFHMGENYTRMELHDPAAVKPAEERVAAIAERLRQRERGGLISIFYHPCEWVHREFWDGYNFKHGANPPREEWKAPPQLPPEETEAAFQRFGQYVDYIRALPESHFVTAADLPGIYPDPVRQKGVSETVMDTMATRILEGKNQGLNFQVIEGRAYSLADQFEALAIAMAAASTGVKPNFPVQCKGLFGPDSAPPTLLEERSIGRLAFRDTLRDVADFVKTQGRVPSRVFIGPDAVPPESFLITMASAWKSAHDGQSPMPGEKFLVVKSAVILSQRQISADTSKVFGDWVIHKEGFRAPKILEQARLQAWTLKPAIAK